MVSRNVHKDLSVAWNTNELHSLIELHISRLKNPLKNGLSFTYVIYVPTRVDPVNDIAATWGLLHKAVPTSEALAWAQVTTLTTPDYRKKRNNQMNTLLNTSMYSVNCWLPCLNDTSSMMSMSSTKLVAWIRKSNDEYKTFRKSGFLCQSCQGQSCQRSVLRRFQDDGTSSGQRCSGLFIE